MSNDKFLVIIPALNEEKNIGKVIEQVRSVTDDILVINDASTDETRNILQKMNVKHINLITKLQYGATVQTGVRYALSNDYQFAAFIDGDGQHNPKHLPEMLDAVKKGETDLIIGTRSGSDYIMPTFRKMGSQVFSSIIKLITGKTITDPTSGYQVFNRKIMSSYCSDTYPADYPDADVIIGLILNGFKVSEMPVTMYPSPEKSMHTSLSVFYYVYKMTISIIIAVLRNSSIKKSRA